MFASIVQNCIALRNRTSDTTDVVISKLPRWVWFGAWVLAFIAGIINVIGLLGFEHQTISHLTGTTSMFAASFGAMNGAKILHYGVILGSFLVGTVLSGFIIEDSALKLGRPYGVALFIESILLFCSMLLFRNGNELGLYFASCACGLQNAMVSTFSGTVIRTTHLSGMWTDLGVFLGHALRGRRPNVLRMKLSFLVISGFFSGGVAGAIAFARIGYFTLLFPALLTGLASLTYMSRRAREQTEESLPKGIAKLWPKF
jgi:uncharacterized membrane protein YoaK (UPF0700 family)